MNVEMLKYIVELSGGADTADADTFLKRYPLTDKNFNDLEHLELLNFVKPVYADRTLKVLFVHPKTHAHF